MKKRLYIIAGCNGAGKTTASFTILPDILECREFVNADEIAKGLSPFQPEKVAFESGRIMLHRIDELIAAGETFAFETTLATKSYRTTIREAKEKGFYVTLLFFWLNDVELAVERVKTRVREGGHNIPEDVIRRRYRNGIKNLFEIYLPVVDDMFIFDNSNEEPALVAEKSGAIELIVVDTDKFESIENEYTQ